MANNRRKFEDELKDLEGIVAQIDSGELSLEDSITAFERGVGEQPEVSANTLHVALAIPEEEAERRVAGRRVP